MQDSYGDTLFSRIILAFFLTTQVLNVGYRYKRDGVRREQIVYSVRRSVPENIGLRDFPVMRCFILPGGVLLRCDDGCQQKYVAYRYGVFKRGNGFE
jgi:hypothetical protein